MNNMPYFCRGVVLQRGFVRAQNDIFQWIEKGGSEEEPSLVSVDVIQSSPSHF